MGAAAARETHDQPGAAGKTESMSFCYFCCDSILRSTPLFLKCFPPYTQCGIYSLNGCGKSLCTYFLPWDISIHLGFWYRMKQGVWPLLISLRRLRSRQHLTAAADCRRCLCQPQTLRARVTSKSKRLKYAKVNTISKKHTSLSFSNF